jgi:hypothetical protein
MVAMPVKPVPRAGRCWRAISEGVNSEPRITSAATAASASFLMICSFGSGRWLVSEYTPRLVNWSEELKRLVASRPREH